jgi:hypothetical protein
MPREARLRSLSDRHAELIAEGGRANSELVRTCSDEAQRAAVRWGLAGNIVIAWILTNAGSRADGGGRIPVGKGTA